jgi:hypothetical protein
MRKILIVLLAASTAMGCAASAPPRATSAGIEQSPGKASATVQDVIPLTMGNLRGHKMLYNEGWLVVSSSKKSLAFARERSIESSSSAIKRATREMARDTARYGESVTEHVSDAVQTGGSIVSTGTGLTGDILKGTHELAKQEMAYAGESFGKAMDAFVSGNIAIAKRTAADRQELVDLPGNYYRNIAEDFSNLQDLTTTVRQKFSGKIDSGWEQAFSRAGSEFREEYERSGESSNSLAALGPVLFGWLKAFYHGVAAPTSKTIVKTTTAGVTYVVFLPVAATSIVAGRTVQAVGLTVYYTGKTGVKVISPTVEGGLLASMSLLSTAAVPITYTGGAAIGAVNQVAFTAAGPAYAAGVGAASTAVDTTAYVALVTFDAAAGVTKVAINQGASGVVLGYNALTAIPTHTLLAAGDAAIFLAWDGPRLVIAAAQGEIGSKAEGTGSLSDLPVGTVVDLGKVRSAPGAKVEVLSTDEQVIKDVLEKLPADLRAGEER